MQKKNMISIFVCVLLIAVSFSSVTGTIDENESLKEESDFKNTFESIISLGDGYKLFMIGRITNLQIGEYETIFNPINLWFFGVQEIDGVTTWYAGHTKNQDKIFHISSEFKGILTKGFICGIIDLEQEVTPPITFSKTDMISTNTLTVISADPADMVWSDFDLWVDGIASAHGMSGTVTAGDIIDITAIAGTGAYIITIRHIPTNTLIGSWDFAAAS